MRLQLVFFALLICWGSLSFAQTNPDSIPLPEPIEIDFLLNYYEQDGNHSAVTGGNGTELLYDVDGKINVYVPLDSISSLNVNAGLNQYTSASTDNIDSRISSASRQDRRALIKVEYDRKNKKKRSGWSIWGGASLESDYASTSLGFGWSKSSRDGNRELSIRAETFFDTWIVIYPEELRNQSQFLVKTDKRRSFNLSGTLSQVINKRLQGSVTAGLVLQNGLLSTPFHRVYFQGQPLARIEHFPDWRIKIPVGIRMHYFLGDFMVLRFFQRAYWDSFGILASSSSLDLPVMLGPHFTVSPYYRFHVQSASRFFKPYAEHDLGEMYYTSDYDLSGFFSQQYGLGLKISPLYGLFRFKTGGKRRKLLLVQSLEFKWMNYERSDGLKAVIFSGDLGFRIR